MPNYIARVELHSASYDDYDNLHGQMLRRGFARAVKGDDGRTYQLPTGSYLSTGSFASASAALQAAVAAAAATGKASAIIAADWNCASWQGLSITNAARSV